MKPKVLNKRLVLNKKTIVDLSNTEMDEMFGGVTIRTCNSNNYPNLSDCPLDCVTIGCPATVTC